MMIEFRGSFFRQQQTEYCAQISQLPQRDTDEHNPPGSMFRERQTLHIYGTLRASYQPDTPSPLPPHPAPQIESPQPPPATPSPSAEPYQASEFLSFDLSHVHSRRLCLMGAVRLLERAAQIGNTDGLHPKDLRSYSKNVAAAHTRFDRTIKPKGLLGSLREKLFDD